jgi:hypothetical protein
MGERPQRYLIIREDTNRIVARKFGMHATLEALCNRLDARYGVVFFYDDPCEAHRYLPMDGPPLPVIL